MTAVAVTSVGCDVAMELDEVFASRSPQQIVGVLRDLDDVRSTCQGEMTGIRPGTGHLDSPRRVPIHDQLGILREAFG